MAVVLVLLATIERAPHKITTWVRELAGNVHGFYHDCYVLGDGVAYRFDRRGRPRSLLRHIRSLVVVTTYGSSSWVNLLEGEPGRRTVRWALRALLGWRARSRWLACYRMDTAGDAARRRFLDRVQRELSRL